MMFKTLVMMSFLLTLSTAESKVEARWMTVASVIIDDGKTKLLFDPAWTRPSLLHWLGLKKLISDEALVGEILKKEGLERIDAVFASHSHFDHVVDAPMISKLTGGVFYTDESSERIALAYKEPRIRTISLSPLKEIRVGDFLITPLKRSHAKLLQKFDFLPGAVPEDMDLSFWDYHVGDSWSYLIKHPEGVILLDPSCESYVDEVKRISPRVDVVFQGLASRKDDESILEGYIKALNPKVYVPLHFDNFFADFKAGGEGDLIGMKVDALLDKIKKAHPTMKADRPKYGKPIKLLEVER